MTNGSRMRAISQLQDIVLWDLILVLEGLRVQKVQVHLKYETRYILGQLGVFFNSGLRIENLSESRLDWGISWESLGISFTKTYFTVVAYCPMGPTFVGNSFRVQKMHVHQFKGTRYILSSNFGREALGIS